jgi:uncharacterized protein YqcC (DUF446 family)
MRVWVVGEGLAPTALSRALRKLDVGVVRDGAGGADLCVMMERLFVDNWRPHPYQINELIVDLFWRASQVAMECYMQDIPLIFISSDEVMGEWRQGPFVSGERLFPSTEYGFVQAMTEQTIRNLPISLLIIRVTSLFTSHHPLIVSALESTRPFAVSARENNHTYLYSFIARLANKIASNEGFPYGGVVHSATDEDPISWYEFLSSRFEHVLPTPNMSSRTIRGGLVPTEGWGLGSYDFAWEMMMADG